jgi:hypothetical protein
MMVESLETGFVRVHVDPGIDRLGEMYPIIMMYGRFNADESLMMVNEAKACLM